MKPVFLTVLVAVFLSGCADPQWALDPTTPPRAWTTHPVTKHFRPLRGYYEIHPGGTVTAYLRPAYSPIPLHIETGRSGETAGAYGSWTMDATFHGITERYWGHYSRSQNGKATLTVVRGNYKLDPDYETRRAEESLRYARRKR